MVEIMIEEVDTSTFLDMHLVRAIIWLNISLTYPMA